ncbi:MAG: hypothetical protein ACK49H_04575 [Burkholderiales bacterium]|jgi:hypothetical protein
MERASQAEIAQRRKEKDIRVALFTGFFAALIPLFNAGFYYVQGKRVQRVAKEQHKIAWVYRLMVTALLLLPLIAMGAGFIFIGTRHEYLAVPAMWVAYVLPAYLIAKKHLAISLAAGTFYAD